MNKQELHDILEKLASGKFTDEEYSEFAHWMKMCSKEEYNLMLIYWEQLVDSRDIYDDLSPSLIEKIEKGLDEFDRNDTISVIPFLPVPEKKTHLWAKVAIAASVLVFLSLFGYLGLYMNTKQPVIAQNQIHDIVPGGNKAILTLSNGKQVVLAYELTGSHYKQGSTVINKTADGQIVYHAMAGQAKTISYNILTTPKGGQYSVVLPDGTKVLLNAASSLRYPVAFTGKERRVELTGEAYFQVIHNDALPFRVITGGQTIEDIGTHFNINSYADDDAIKTTLLEGSIKVSAGTSHVVLKKPGQQSQISNELGNTGIKVIENADTEEAVAWKNGLFEFKKADIKQVMNNAARWYDLNVIYEGKVPDIKISGRMSRNVNLSGLINLLKFEGVKFRIEKKNVTILNN